MPSSARAAELGAITVAALAMVAAGIVPEPLLGVVLVGGAATSRSLQRLLEVIRRV